MNAQSVHLSPESDLAIVDNEHPWPGLASFREQDEHFFKGRGADIEKLHSLVERERLTVLFGVSGLGKSSLLQAGLFPRLRLENLLPVAIRLDFTDAAVSLGEQVFAAIARQVQNKAMEAPMHRENETLWEYFHRKDSEFWDARNRIVIPLLCFDQFEEVFTLGREDLKRGADLKQFITELADLVEGRCPESVKARLDSNPAESKNFSFSRHPYKLIFSLREDYLADLEGLRGLMPSLIHNRLRLLQMNGEQALAVADQTQGRLMERSVAETIVRLVGGKQDEQSRELSVLRIEPALLSLVCRELNERRINTQASRIDAQSVASNREQILENFYERSLAGQSPELRRFIEDKLITVSGFRNSEAYDNAVGIPGITAEALASLVQCRVLRLEERDGVKRIELIHDVLTGVVRKSRDQRQILEKQRQAEQERSVAEQREQAVREALRVSKRRAWVFLILTGIAVLSSAWGWWSWWDAKQARSKAQHALALSDFREAEQHYQNNNIPYALAHLAHAVRTDPEWVSSRTLLVNLLQQRSWFLPVAIFNHKYAVDSASFSPDGTQVLTTSSNNSGRRGDAETGKPMGSARLWDAKTGKPLGEAMTHQGFVYSAQFSPDGTRVVTASGDKSVRLWDAKTGQPLGEAMAHQDRVSSAQFSPDGTRVVTVSGDTFFDRGSARLWDAKTGKPLPLGDAMMHQDTTHAPAFSLDGTTVVIVSGISARLWDAKTGKPLGEAMTHQHSVHSTRFSPDGTRVVTTALDDRSARLWDAKTGKPLGEAMTHQGYVYSARFSPDGTHVVTASWDKTARLWDAQTGKPLGDAMTHQGSVWSAEFSPDGTRVVTVSGDTARMWDVKTGKSLGDAIMHQDGVLSAEFSPDGTQVVTASWGTGARLWDAKTGQPLGEAMMHQDGVKWAQFSPDGTRVLTLSGDIATRRYTAGLWDTKTGKPLGEAITHQDRVESAQFSPDGTRVLILSGGNAAQLWTARLWDANTGKPLGEAMTHQYPVASAQFSPDGTRVLTASYKSARLWDANTGKPLGEAMTHQYPVKSAQFIPDGTRVLTVACDTARMWDAKTGQSLGEAMMPQGDVRSAQFSPDGTRVLTVSGDTGRMRMWDARTGKPVGDAMTPQGGVGSAQFSPDGTRVVTASGDTARMWDVKTGKPLGEAMKHEGSVHTAQFSPDGTRVVTASGNSFAYGVGTARLWDAQTGKPLGDAMTHQGTVYSAEFSPDGTQVVTRSGSDNVRLWDVSPVVSDNGLPLSALAESVAGNKLNDLGAVEPLENQIGQLNNLRLQTANAPLGEPTAESFIRWFLSDPWTRTVSPLSELTVPDYIRQQIAAYRRDQMEQEFPGHPLLRPEKASNQPLTPPPDK